MIKASAFSTDFRGIRLFDEMFLSEFRHSSNQEVMKEATKNDSDNAEEHEETAEKAPVKQDRLFTAYWQKTVLPSSISLSKIPMELQSMKAVQNRVNMKRKNYGVWDLVWSKNTGFWELHLAITFSLGYCKIINNSY